VNVPLVNQKRYILSNAIFMTFFLSTVSHGYTQNEASFPIRALEGDNCNHTICSNCRDIIVSNTNKCPICRLKLDNNITDEEESDTESEYTGTENSDDESDWGDDDDNEKDKSKKDSKKS
jgi:hypothetical protein